MGLQAYDDIIQAAFPACQYPISMRSGMIRFCAQQTSSVRVHIRSRANMSKCHRPSAFR